MSMMRFRPQPPFADFLQRVLQEALMESPATLHPQNIGDMVQVPLTCPPRRPNLLSFSANVSFMNLVAMFEQDFDNSG